MPRVELIYDTNCPNVEGARKALVEAFAVACLAPSWTEWDRQSAEGPPHVRHYGSPTILVDGRDIAGAEPVDGSDSCRVYDHSSGVLRGVPPVEHIAAALANLRVAAQEHLAKNRRGTWRFLAALPGVGAALVPVGACPACWPAYAGILSSFGLGFLFDSTHLLPVTVALLGLAMFTLAFRARTHRGYGPLLLGIASACFVLVFKFAYVVYVVDTLVYAGLLGLVAATLWNAWPRTRNETGSCPKCRSEERATETGSARRAGDPADQLNRVLAYRAPGAEHFDLPHQSHVRTSFMADTQAFRPVRHRRLVHVENRDFAAVVIDGKLAGCCAGRGPDEAALRRSGVGQPF